MHQHIQGSSRLAYKVPVGEKKCQNDVLCQMEKTSNVLKLSSLSKTVLRVWACGIEKGAGLRKG
jgi:hypothetical protein